MKPSLPVRHALVLATAVVALTSCSGTSDAMGQMASKFRRDVRKALSENNFPRANNVAIASCFFAKEMEAAGVKIPKADSAQQAPPKKTNPGPASGGVVNLGRGMVDLSEAREMIEKTVLDPNQPITRLTADDYQVILGWVLSPRDIDILKQIRARSGYWEKLQSRLEK